MKSFIKTPITPTKEYTPMWVKVNFTTFNDSYIKIRTNNGDYSEDWVCFKCSTPFSIGDSIGMACLKEVGNQKFCKTCAEYIKYD